MKHLFVKLLTVATLSASLLSAQSLPQRALERVDALAATEFARDSVASLTVGVVTDQGLVWTKTYGFADMSSRTLANRQSVYRIGSITKMYTGLMLHQLVAEGKIRLSDPVERYYPEIREIRGYAKLEQPITVQQLATMTSGIAREPEQEGPFWTGQVSMWDSTLHLALSHTNLELAPGEKFLYSNIGYAILGATLSRAAGMPFMKWQQDKIFAPLGMEHTAFEINGSITSGLTRGYDIRPGQAPNNEQSAREALSGRGFKVPNGAIYTTIDDISKFVLVQLGRGPASVVPPARLDSAYRAVLDASGKPRVVYGVGFMVQQVGPYVAYGHGGAVAGYGAAIGFDREHHVGVIALRNALGGPVNPQRIVEQILEAVVSAKLASASGGAR